MMGIQGWGGGEAGFRDWAYRKMIWDGGGRRGLWPELLLPGGVNGAEWQNGRSNFGCQFRRGSKSTPGIFHVIPSASSAPDVLIRLHCTTRQRREGLPRHHRSNRTDRHISRLIHPARLWAAPIATSAQPCANKSFPKRGCGGDPPPQHVHVSMSTSATTSRRHVSRESNPVFQDVNLPDSCVRRCSLVGR